MSLTVWSRRSVYLCLGLWIALICVYVVLGALRHELLPQPFNLLIVVALALVTGVSGIACVIGWYAEKAALASDLRHTRQYALLSAIERRLDEVEASLPRRELVAVGADDRTLPGYSRGYVDGLARRPMDAGAKVIPLEGRGDSYNRSP